MNPKSKHMLVATILILPCVGGGATNAASGAPAASSGSVCFEMETFLRSSGDCSEQEDGCATVSMNFPVAMEGDAAVATAINKRVQRILTDSLDTGADTASHLPTLGEAASLFFKEYEEFAGKADAQTTGWSVDATGKIILQNHKLAVVSLDTYSYTGGAHPNSHKALFNFDTATGKTLRYKDFVSDIGALKQIAERHFKLTRGLAEDADLKAEGFFWDKRFKLSKNFAVTEDGLRFYYNSYEAAPYAAGPTDFVIPWNELEKVVDRGRIF